MIDKGLYQAPQGLDELTSEEPALEIEIEDPESVKIGMGGLEIILEPEDEESSEDFNANLADDMDEGDLETLANELIGSYDDDCGARKDWIQTYVDGLELLGLKIGRASCRERV